MTEETTIRDDVMEVFAAAGFEVRDTGHQFAITGTVDSAALLLEHMLESEGEKIEKARKFSYQAGYRAGNARKVREEKKRQEYNRDAAFLDRAYLALLPVAMAAQGWKIGDKPITTSADRTNLAVRWAREALKQRPKP